MFRSLSKPGHDYGKFGTGSKKTLLEDARENNIEPREALLKFHQRHYSSDMFVEFFALFISSLEKEFVIFYSFLLFIFCLP